MGLRDVPVVTAEEAARDPLPRDARVVVPTGSDAEQIVERARQNQRCGMCRHFRLRQGQEEFRDQQLFERLFSEMEHDPLWYGRTDLFGLCARWDGHMVHAFAPRRIARHFLDSSVTYANKDESVECPDWDSAGVGQRGTPSFAGKRRNYEET